MDSIQSLGTEALIRQRALIRISAIAAATSVDEVTYRFGLATGYLAAAVDARTISDEEWERLLILANDTQDAHPLANGGCGRFD